MTDHPGPVIAARDGLHVVECQRCGYAHLRHMPHPAALERFYASDFWQKEKAGWRERYEAQAEWDNARWGDWLALLGEHGNGGRGLLDIGSGYGGFVRAANDNEWNAVGWEPSVDAAHYANVNRAPTQQQGWTPDTLPELAADVISALWLIEHLPNPLEFLEWCRDTLAAGGLLLVAVPNEFNLWQLHANRKAAVKDYWVHHTHLNYFTQATLANLLGRAGFAVIDRLATYPMERFILGGQDYTRADGTGDACHATVRANDRARSRQSRITYYRNMARVGLGRDQVVIARSE